MVSQLRPGLDFKKLGLVQQLIDQRRNEVWASWTQNFEELRLKAATLGLRPLGTT